MTKLAIVRALDPTGIHLPAGCAGTAPTAARASGTTGRRLTNLR